MKHNAIIAGVGLFRALGNLKRLEILFYLLGKELNVTELEKLVGISQSSLSQHLAVLRNAKIVKTRREAQTIFYSISNDKIVKLLYFIEKLYAKPYGS